MVAAALSALFVTIGTMVGELLVVDGSKIFKDLLKAAHHHHWVGKGVWAGIIFVLVTVLIYIVTRKKDMEASVVKATNFLSYSLASGTIILFIFFIYEYLIHH
ncbi:hypothetical protein N8083_00405 [Candidatus Pacebacteria bacterium]|nr:hypothetical protein [Candidatus Paceibacterota bacterium]